MDATATTLDSGALSPHEGPDARITAYGMLLETHAALGAVVERDLEDVAGLPMTWLGVLIRLSRNPGERLRMRELAEQVLFSTSGLTRLIDRMEQAGLVERVQCPEDRRGSFAVLTDEGRAVLDASLPRHLETLDRHLVVPLGSEQLARLTELLETVRDHAKHELGGPDAQGAGAL